MSKTIVGPLIETAVRKLERQANITVSLSKSALNVEKSRTGNSKTVASAVEGLEKRRSAVGQFLTVTPGYELEFKELKEVGAQENLTLTNDSEHFVAFKVDML